MEEEIELLVERSKRLEGVIDSQEKELFRLRKRLMKLEKKGSMIEAIRKVLKNEARQIRATRRNKRIPRDTKGSGNFVLYEEHDIPQAI